MTNPTTNIDVGSRIGRLTLTERIGHGGFSIVYRAYDEALDADVAVKVLADNHSLDPEIRTRFLAEGRVLRKVAHPSLIQVYDVGETDTHRPYLVLQLASGGSLADRMRVRREAAQPTTAADLIAITNGLESAIGAIHDVGIVHRDVSPGNIFIMRTGPSNRAAPDGGDRADTAAENHGPLLRPGERLVLGDLGLAKDLGATSGITVGGGTPQFAAPEQQQPAGTVTPSADVYGASMLLRWAATDSPLSAEVERLTASGVNVDPDQRPATIATWADQIRSGLSQADQRSEPVPDAVGRPAAASQVEPHHFSTASLTVAAFVAAICLSGPAFWSYYRTKSALTTRDSENTVAVAVDNSTIAAGWDNQSWSYQSPFDETGTIEFATYGALSLVADDPINVSDTARLVGEIQPADASIAIRLNGETFRPCPLFGSTGLTSTDGNQLRFEIPLTVLGREVEVVNRLSLINTKDDRLSLQVSKLAVEEPSEEESSTSTVACGP